MGFKNFELESLLIDEAVEDIVLKPSGLSFFKGGRWYGPTPSQLCERSELLRISQFLAESASLQLGLTQPTADAFLKLDSDHTFRAHVIVTPMVLEGPEITLRRIPIIGNCKTQRTWISEDMETLLVEAFLRGDSFLICGPTGSGKSTFLSSLLQKLPNCTRVLILEDSPELPLPNMLSSKLLARPNRYGFREGVEWDLSDLLFESLRMRPDRIVLGECRGPEARVILQALKTGHRGVATTIHAGSSEEALCRFMELAGDRGINSVENVPNPWDWVLTISLDADGQRRIHHLRHKNENL